jgi:2-polyprenyl-6-methoxyphenol hydroxylase-like FAD-dependent oxidoreductase
MKPKILIAGGGIGGLSAAACLLKAGYPVEIFEQAPSLGEIGAGIQISANAMHVLNYIGAGPEIMTRASGRRLTFFGCMTAAKRSDALRSPTSICA